MTCRWPAACCKRWVRSGCWLLRRRLRSAISRTRSNRQAAFLCHVRGRWGKTSAFSRIPLPEKFGALSLSDLLLGADAGREAAVQGMEAALMRLGMPLCRVLPFRRKLTAP